MVAAVQRAVASDDGRRARVPPGHRRDPTRRTLPSTASLPSHVDVYALAGALSLEEQDRALAPSPAGRRRVVLSTDIAETSLTVDGVRIVIDAGLAREPRFDARTGLSRLTTVTTSRASADQRAGRAGRTEPGVAYRLWSKIEHGSTAAPPVTRDRPGRPRRVRPRIGGVGHRRRATSRSSTHHRRARSNRRRHCSSTCMRSTRRPSTRAIDGGLDHPARPIDARAPGPPSTGTDGGDRAVDAGLHRRLASSTSATCSVVDPTTSRPTCRCGSA